jgi:hypothetical protein
MFGNTTVSSLDLSSGQGKEKADHHETNNSYIQQTVIKAAAEVILNSSRNKR